MQHSRLRPYFAKLLGPAGITLDGPNRSDPQIHDERFFWRVLAHGSLGLGESYTEGWWDCERLDEFIFLLLRSGTDGQVSSRFLAPLRDVAGRLVNLQSRSRAFQIGREHYDKGNDLYQAMLDSRLTYTCGYWKTAQNLEQAQEAKLDLVCRKLGLKAGQRVLDIGCGWGSFMKFAAERYGVQCVGLTVSKEQVALGRELCRGLPIEFRLQDYREINEGFDHIVSLGMFEHVGYKNYPTFMRVAERCLKDDGLFLLHTFGNNVSIHTPDPWFHRYIFPNGMAPSIAQIGRAAEQLFVMEDWHNFGYDYSLTLLAWYKNFNEHWPELKNKYDERFYRMWKYYLLSLAGAFRARNLQLWQMVFSKKGVGGGYHSVR